MNTIATTSLFLVSAVLVYLAWLLLGRLGTNRRSLERVFTEPVDLVERPDGDTALEGLLRRWLFLAGYRQPIAPAAFVTAMLVAIGVGLAAALAFLGSGVTKELFATLAILPPPMGDLLLPVAYLAPWTVLLILVLLPCMAVRRSRRQRVEKVEQDLPIGTLFCLTDESLTEVGEAQTLRRKMLLELPDGGNGFGFVIAAG